MTRMHRRSAQALAAIFLLAAVPALCTGANWWDDAEAEDDGYRVVNYTEKFENEGTEEGSAPECSWECSASKYTGWYITEHNGDVRYSTDDSTYTHVSGEGGAGTVEVSSSDRVYVEYWPGVLPTEPARSDSGTATSGGDTTLTDTGKAWESSVCVDGTVSITGGTGAGQLRTVSGNTATQLTVSEAWETHPDAT